MHKDLKKWRITWEANNRFEAQKRKQAHLDLQKNVQGFLNDLSNKRAKENKDNTTKRKADNIRQKIAISSWLKNTKMKHQENYKQLHQNLSDKLKTLKKYTLNFLIKFIENNKEQTLVARKKRTDRINEIKNHTRQILAK